jgi:hypothetical protein
LWWRGDGEGVMKWNIVRVNEVSGVRMCRQRWMNTIKPLKEPSKSKKKVRKKKWERRR